MQLKTTKILVLLCLSLLALATEQAKAQTSNVHAFSIQQCVDYANKNSATVKNALLDIKIQHETNRGITSSALPQVSASFGYTDYLNIPTQVISDFISPAVYGVLTHEQVKNGSTGNTISSPSKYNNIAAQFSTKYTANGTAQLQQLLFDGQVFIALQARSTSMAFQQKALEVTQESIKVNIYKIYYQLVVSKSQIELLDSNITRLEKLLHDATEMYKNGFAEKLDIDKLNVQLANLKTEKQKALNSIEIGYLGLKTLMGMPVNESLTLTDKINEDAIKDGLLTDTTNQFQNRKEFQYLSLAKKLNEFNIRRYKLAYLPSFSAIGAYGKQASRNKFTFADKGDWFTTSYFGFNLSVPIFDGFNKDSKIKQARYELEKTSNSIDNFKLTVSNDMTQASLNFKSAISTLDYQKKNMALAETVYNQTKKKFEVGTGSNTEINTAEIDLKTAQTNYINALYDAVIAKVDYLKATGKLQ